MRLLTIFANISAISLYFGILWNDLKIKSNMRAFILILLISMYFYSLSVDIFFSLFFSPIIFCIIWVYFINLNWHLIYSSQLKADCNTKIFHKTHVFEAKYKLSFEIVLSCRDKTFTRVFRKADTNYYFIRMSPLSCTMHGVTPHDYYQIFEILWWRGGTIIVSQSSVFLVKIR